jgi:hypothetical protein
MKVKLFFILFFAICCQNSSIAQKKLLPISKEYRETLRILEDSIVQLSNIAVRDTLVEKRMAAQEKLEPLLRVALGVPNAFSYPFERLESISIQTAPDNSFRIFTWQVMEDYEHFKYYGFIQINHPKAQLVTLQDQSRSIFKPEIANLTPEEWLGGVYYHILPFKAKDGLKYLLMGFNSNNDDEKLKFCDVLTISDNVLNGKKGQIKFGAPVFSKADKGEKKKTHRLMLYYSAEASIRFNYDAEMGLLIHDHLESAPARRPTVPYVGIPDGTYEAYKLKNGIWEHIDQLPNTPMKEAPMTNKALKRNTGVINKADVKDFEVPKDAIPK